ncbi:MAG TPA: glycosyltransferase [Solirubrobacteraceae bacterium]|nr:glycosyltransferase [Solirubrobacteraceae bacterium]
MTPTTASDTADDAGAQQVIVSSTGVIETLYGQGLTGSGPAETLTAYRPSGAVDTAFGAGGSTALKIDPSDVGSLGGGVSPFLLPAPGGATLAVVAAGDDDPQLIALQANEQPNPALGGDVGGPPRLVAPPANPLLLRGCKSSPGGVLGSRNSAAIPGSLRPGHARFSLANRRPDLPEAPLDSARMRILTVGNMYPPHHFGGYELIWRSWVRHAESSGHTVRVLTTDFRHPGEPIEGAQETEDVHRALRWYWRDHAFPRPGPRERWSIERHNARLIEGQLREFAPDVVVWWAMAGMSLSPIERVRRAGVPAVGFLDDYWLEYGPTVDAWLRPFLSRPRLARAMASLPGVITRVDLVSGIRFVFSSEILRQGALRAWPDLPHTEVVPHEPPDVEWFTLAPSEPWSWRLLFVGRIEEVKGVDLAVLALLDLPDAAVLTVVGSGSEDYLAGLHALVAERGLRDRVRFERHKRTELPAVYARADVVLFPSRWKEPFGLVPLEAMGVGRPVIATGRGGSGEYLRDGENCLIFDPDHGPGELAERIRRLADDQALRARLREGGRHTLQAIRDARFNERVLATVERARANGSAP